MNSRLIRLVTISTLLAAVAWSPWASAQRVTCNLLKDPVGDTQSAVPDGDPDLDLVGGDIATDGKHLTAVIRLDTLKAEDITEPGGRTWEFDFTANDQNFLLLATLLPGGHEYGAYISDTRFEEGEGGARSATGIGELKGTLDLKHHQVRLTGPLSIFQKYASFNQTYIDHLVMFSYRAHGESMRALPTGSTADISASMGVGVDEAWSSRHYVPRAPSCIRVGT